MIAFDSRNIFDAGWIDLRDAVRERNTDAALHAALALEAVCAVMVDVIRTFNHDGRATAMGW